MFEMMIVELMKMENRNTGDGLEDWSCPDETGTLQAIPYGPVFTLAW